MTTAPDEQEPKGPAGYWFSQPQSSAEPTLSRYGSEGWGFESLQARYIPPGQSGGRRLRERDDHDGENIRENIPWDSAVLTANSVVISIKPINIGANYSHGAADVGGPVATAGGTVHVGGSGHACPDVTRMALGLVW